MGSCGEKPSNAASLQGAFNLDAVYDTMTLPAEAEGQIPLNGYELSGPDGGTLQFSKCADVLSLSDADVVPSETFFFRKYRIDCHAAQKFLAGQSSRDSFFERPLSDIILQSPAIITPQIGERAVFEKRLGATFEQFFGVDAVQLDSDQTSNKTASFVVEKDVGGVEVEYLILGRRDLNEDGYEDLIIEMTYNLVEGSGRGIKLYALSKTSDRAPITIVWEY